MSSSFEHTRKMLLTPAEAAKSLGISPRTLWTLTASGEVPSIKIGRLVRYPVDDLEQWIASRLRGGDA